MGMPGVPQSMELQKIGLDLLTEQQLQIPLKISTLPFKYIFLPYVIEKLVFFNSCHKTN